MIPTRDYHGEIASRTSTLPVYAINAINDIMRSAIEAALIADRAYENIVEVEGHVESAESTVPVLKGVLRDVLRERARFDELLAATHYVATQITNEYKNIALQAVDEAIAEHNKAFPVPEMAPPPAALIVHMPAPAANTLNAANTNAFNAPVADAPLQPEVQSSAPEMPQWHCEEIKKDTKYVPNINDVAPHQYGMRDMVHVNLGMPSIGKITLRGPIVAICELTEPCWYQCGKTKFALNSEIVYESVLAPIGTEIICTIEETGRMVPLVPNQRIIGYATRRPFAEKIVGMPLPNCDRGFQSYNITYDDLGFMYWMLSQGEWSQLGRARWGLHNSIVSPYGDSKYTLSEDNRYMTPVFKVKRYEQSYNVLVAAPHEFELDRLRMRVKHGETLNLRMEIERVLLGTESPLVVYGRGVEFEHVLESQIKLFAL